MARKTKGSVIEDLQDKLKMYLKIVEDLTSRNNELLDAQEGAFLHSPTYLQMESEIEFLKNVQKLMEQNLARSRAQVIQSEEERRQLYLDNKMLLKAQADADYFVGIADAWEGMQDYQKLKNENHVLQGMVEQMQISMAERESELARLREQLSEVIIHASEAPTSGGPSGSQEHNARGAGRKPMNEAMQQQLSRFRELYDAGWSRDGILSEMNLSQATYYRYRRILGINY